jgi:general secretion pathway protein G
MKEMAASDHRRNGLGSGPGSGIGARPARFSRWPGFTLIELLVVMVIVSILISLAAPRYFNSLEKSKEAVLRQDLALMREALDKFYGDRGKYPDTLDELASQKYLRSIPTDPFTESAATWVAIPPADVGQGGVYDIKSGAVGQGRDGSEYREW